MPPSLPMPPPFDGSDVGSSSGDGVLSGCVASGVGSAVGVWVSSGWLVGVAVDSSSGSAVGFAVLVLPPRVARMFAGSGNSSTLSPSCIEDCTCYFEE